MCVLVDWKWCGCVAVGGAVLCVSDVVQVCVGGLSALFSVLVESL